MRVTGNNDVISVGQYHFGPASKVATFVNNEGFRISGTANDVIEVGDGYNGATTPVVDANNKMRSSFCAQVQTPATTNVRAGLRLPHGTAPASPVNGDMWTTSAGLFSRINGATVGPLRQEGPLKPTAALFETIPRTQRLEASMALLNNSGRITLQAIYLPAGTVVSTISWITGTTGVTTPANQWAALYDSSLALLRVSDDKTTEAWAANTLKTFTLATTYTVTTAGWFYVALNVTAAAVPTLWGANHTNATIATLAPALCFIANTGLTNPASAPNPAVSAGVNAGCAYAYVS
jgi:hypothetical protein